MKVGFVGLGSMGSGHAVVIGSEIVGVPGAKNGEYMDRDVMEKFIRKTDMKFLREAVKMREKSGTKKICGVSFLTCGTSLEGIKLIENG